MPNTIQSMIRSSERTVTTGISTAANLTLSEWTGSTDFNNFLTLSSKKDILKWMAYNSTPAERERVADMRVLDELTDIGATNPAEIRRLVRLLLWGGSDLIETASRFYHGKRSSVRFRLTEENTDAWMTLLRSEWRMAKPMDKREFSLLRTLFSHAPREYIRSGDFAFTVIRDRSALQEFSPVNGLSTGYMFRRQIFRDVERNTTGYDALSWSMLFHKMFDKEDNGRGEWGAEDYAHYQNIISLVIPEFPFDEAHHYVAAGVFDPSVIRRGLDNDIDPELLSGLDSIPRGLKS